MPYFFFVWDPEREEKLELHGVDMEDFETVVQNPAKVESSRSSDRYIAFGYSADDRWMACVYEMLDEVTVLPITAYYPEEA
ncbi:MAG: hypothetical protein ACC628_24570 [Pirellulaceae bacterium]